MWLRVFLAQPACMSAYTELALVFYRITLYVCMSVYRAGIGVLLYHPICMYVCTLFYRITLYVRVSVYTELALVFYCITL